MTTGLAGRHALVLGGSSGLGLATATALAADGARVTLRFLCSPEASYITGVQLGADGGLVGSF